MAGGALDGLPKQFVHAMRTLFDIMDDKRTGFVRFTEIEHRWRDDGTKGLPRGVIESLRKVTPPNGLLSFERFCTGLRICLLKNQKNEMKCEEQQPTRPPSAPLLDTENVKKAPNWGTAHAPIRPNYAHRTVSMPQLISKEENTVAPVKAPIHPMGPPKPPRLGLGQNLLLNPNNNNNNNAAIDKLEIRNALQNWQMGVLQADKRPPPPQQQHQFATLGRLVGRSMGDGKSAVIFDVQHKKPGGGRRREPRRHTLQNGIDYNMLRRMKQLEQEKEVLLQGLQSVERAREWYVQQLAALNEKMSFLGRDACYHSEQWSEAQTERLGMQRARVLEVNRQLAALTDPSVPLHMNLAVGVGATESFMSRLKQQNHMLTQEVRKKSDHVTSLEREKSSLLRELYQARSQQDMQ